MNLFSNQSLIPCVVQSVEDKKVLMLAYMNQEAYEITLKTGILTFYSRSRQSLWVKGETSGNRLELLKLSQDCDSDTLLALVTPSGPVCHTGQKTCFESPPIYEKEGFKDDLPSEPSILSRLFLRIEDRKVNPKEKAYTTYLFNSGLDKILKKVGEEASEVIIASKNQCSEEFLNECADLIYHLWVLISAQNLQPSQVYKVLESREQ